MFWKEISDIKREKNRIIEIKDKDNFLYIIDIFK